MIVRNHISDFCRNETGKLSGSGLAGLFICFGTLLTFIIGAVASFLKFTDGLNIMEQSLMGMAVGSALLGVRKLSKQGKDFVIDKENEVDSSPKV
jgi:hypothetical protein